MVTVGRIIRPHHNRGHVVVMPETDFPHERFAVGSILYRERDGRVEPIYYVFDLVGCMVRTVGGDEVGHVERVDLATGVAMLVVAGDGEVLVPFSEAICTRIDPAGKTIEIDPPPGLVELNRPAKR